MEKINEASSEQPIECWGHCKGNVTLFDGSDDMYFCSECGKYYTKEDLEWLKQPEDE